MRDTPFFGWQMPVALSFGNGCSETLSAALGARSAVVLAFAPARALGLRQRWQAQFGRKLVAWIEVPEGLATVGLARELSAQVWPALDMAPGSVLVAVGGGSTMDIAKLLRCRVANRNFEALVSALRGSVPWPALQPAPLWLLPTTAGTGSEVTRWATLWDTDGELGAKLSFDEAFGYADRAFIDPLLTLSAPHGVTRDTALDALAHALEALWNRHANPISDHFAVAAARRIVDTLPACLRNPDDPALRSELAMGALEAGFAFSQTRTALAHALSYPVTLEQGLPHGQACALWLPTAWRLASGLDAHADGLLAQVFDGGADHLQAWLRSLGASADPRDIGIADAPQRIDAALRSTRGRNFIGAPA